MIEEYYANPSIRKRMLEFLGGVSAEQATAVYLDDSSRPTENWQGRSVRDFERFLSEGREVSRSLWDRQNLLFHLDLEYVNLDYPAEPYLDAERTFALQEPVIDAVYDVLGACEISPRHILSGRGHHFVWQISRGSEAFQLLAEEGRASRSLLKRYSRFSGPAGEKIDPVLGCAFNALGRVMEYLACQIQDRSAPNCKIPVLLTELSTGPIQRGREMISIDISEYGDPLYTRKTRLPFSVYRKPETQKEKLGEEIVSGLPHLFTVPVTRDSWKESLRLMRNPDDLLRHAESTRAEIPVQNSGSKRLIETYLKSNLSEIHEWFQQKEPGPPEKWAETCDRTPLEYLEPCLRFPLQEPNDRLLDLNGIQMVTRALLALGWHPGHISGLIQSKYEGDYGWGNRWRIYDAGLRADFYVRVFSSLILSGRDHLIDFNCLSTKEKRCCIQPESDCTLEDFRDSLIERRENERMACGPFNRLLLPGTDS